MRHHRHHYVELEVSVCTSPRDARVVADHLSANHHDRFAHHRVHFARHDRTARLRGGKLNLANAAARTAPEPADVVRDLHERVGDFE